jgi:hypothetical protein
MSRRAMRCYNLRQLFANGAVRVLVKTGLAQWHAYVQVPIVVKYRSIRSIPSGSTSATCGFFDI